MPIPTKWSEVFLGQPDSKARFAHLFPPVRETEELLSEGRFKEAILYRLREENYLLPHEVQGILRRWTPVEGDLTLAIDNNTIAEYVSPELGGLLLTMLADKTITVDTNSWEGRVVWRAATAGRTTHD